MSMKFKGLSEYDKEFVDPKRKRSYPTLPLEPYAGLRSSDIGLSGEPALPRKKKVEGFPNLATTNMEPPIQRKKRSESVSPIRLVMEPELQRRKKQDQDQDYQKTSTIATTQGRNGGRSYVDDDYVLLGDQSKFNENIKYRVRSRSANQNHHHHHHSPEERQRSRRNDEVRKEKRHFMELKEDGEKDKEVKRRSRSRESRPAPKVTVDTGKPSKAARANSVGMKSSVAAAAARTSSPPQVKKDDRSRFEKMINERKGILRKNAATQSTARIENEIRGRGGGGGSRHHHHHHHRGSQQAVETKGNDRQNAGGGIQVKAASASTKMANEDKEISSKKFDDQRKNYDQQTIELTEKRRRPVVVVPQHSFGGPSRRSEYQREFQWKDPIKSSPLISAETIVYKSHPDLTLFRSSSMAGENSEYKTQFKAWTPSLSDEAQKNKKNNEASDNNTQPKISRSKSTKELSSKPVNKTTNSTAVKVSNDEKFHDGEPVQENEDNLTEEQMTRLRKKYKSEYSSNFLYPWKHNDGEGVWKKAYPKMSQDDVNVPSSAAGWYAEVLELRRSADEYRKRAQGTHFSREHLLQLYAKNADLWDAVSNSSVLSSLSLEGQDRRRSSDKKIPKKTNNTTTKMTTKKVLERNGSKDEFIARSLSNYSSTLSNYSDSDEKENDYRQQQQRHQRKATTTTTTTKQVPAVQRLHLERTIKQNGTVLTSVNQQKKNYDDDNDFHDDDDDDDDYMSYDSLDPCCCGSSQSSLSNDQMIKVSKNKLKTTNDNKSKTYSKVNSQTNTILSHGVPTKDSHVLIDRISRTEYGPDPLRRTKASNVEYEDKGIQIHIDDDDDETISVSSRSLASSCSLASEVLERARNRQNQFWK